MRTIISESSSLSLRDAFTCSVGSMKNIPSSLTNSEVRTQLYLSPLGPDFVFFLFPIIAPPPLKETLASCISRCRMRRSPFLPSRLLTHFSSHSHLIGRSTFNAPARATAAVLPRFRSHAPYRSTSGAADASAMADSCENTNELLANSADSKNKDTKNAVDGQCSKSEAPLPPLSAADFRVFNNMAERMNMFVRFSPETTYLSTHQCPP